MKNHLGEMVRVSPAVGADLVCIERLMQFYNYELSAYYPIDFSPDGRMVISDKADYWASAGVHPYLIHVGAALAGFAVVDGEVILPASQHSLGYFYVARRYQGQGVARVALQTLLARHPGSWEIYYLERNLQAAAFWSKALPQSACRGLSCSTETVDDGTAIVYRFSTGDVAET
jgi:predicted acetyltransferase